MACEGGANSHKSTQNFQDFSVAQHAPVKTLVEKIIVCREYIINGGDGSEASFQMSPVRFQYLKHCVVLEVLDKVEHSLEECKS